MTDLIERLRRWNIAENATRTTSSIMRDLGEAADEIEHLDRLITLKNRQLREDADEIERLRAHIEWIGANTDSPSTALYCHAALKETDDD